MGDAQSSSRNIVLIGCRGSGKSTVGRLLAEQLGRAHIDTDQLIEDRLNRSIADIFEHDGEPFFRKVESEIIESLAPAQPAVISVGGGAVEDEPNRKRLCELGFVVWLTASVEELHRRTTADRESEASRPALTGADPLTEIRNTLAARSAHYEGLADRQIDTTNTPAHTVAKMIAEPAQP